MPKQRAKPELSRTERQRRACRAKTVLLPAAIKATGKRGFAETAFRLAGKEGVVSPKKLAGWLKGQAEEKGVLSPAHSYKGRKRTLTPTKRKGLKKLR